MKHLIVATFAWLFGLSAAEAQVVAGSTTNWLNTAYLAGQIGGDDTIYVPPLKCLSDPNSTYAKTATPFLCGLFAVQSASSPTGATPRALDLFSINNSSVSSSVPIWTIYAEAHNITSAGANTYVAEYEARNIKAPPASAWNPYQTPAGTVDLELGCGAGLAAAGQFNCNVAEYIAANPMPFNAGLSFLPGSVAAISGISPAIQSPANYGFEWWSSASNRVAYLYADAAGSLQLAPTANVVLPDGHGLGWGVTANQTSIGGSTASAIMTFNVGGVEQGRWVNGALDIGTTLGASGYKLNVNGNINGVGYYNNGVAGVTCNGPPSAQFATAGGIVTHC